MRSPSARLSLLTGSVALATLAFGACSSDHSTPTAGPALSDLQSEVIISDVDQLPDFATFSGGNPAAFSIAAGAGAAPSSWAGAMAAFGQACTPAPTRSPANPSNSDTDPVPDSVRFTFDPPCILSRPLETITRTGIVDIMDQTPAVTDWSHTVRWTDFTKTWERVVSGRTTSEKRNGTRVVTADPNGLQHSVTGFRTDYTFADGSTASHERTWSSAFAPDVAGSIQIDAPLPDGLWNVTGTSTWTRGNKSWTFSITTNPQLHYNASCTDAPRFDAGIMHVVVTDNQTNQSFTITITFKPDAAGTGCGEPDRVRS
jgi:hypothetical protein